MSDPEANERLVSDVFDLAFSQGRPEEAIERYMGTPYMQHNPEIADGAAGLLACAKKVEADSPEFKSEIKRTIAGGDLVAVHVLGEPTSDDRALISVDMSGSTTESWSITGTWSKRSPRPPPTWTGCASEPGAY